MTPHVLYQWRQIGCCARCWYFEWAIWMTKIGDVSFYDANPSSNAQDICSYAIINWLQFSKRTLNTGPLMPSSIDRKYHSHDLPSLIENSRYKWFGCIQNKNRMAFRIYQFNYPHLIRMINCQPATNQLHSNPLKWVWSEAGPNKKRGRKKTQKQNIELVAFYLYKKDA